MCVKNQRFRVSGTGKCSRLSRHVWRIPVVAYQHYCRWTRNRASVSSRDRGVPKDGSRGRPSEVLAVVQFAAVTLTTENFRSAFLQHVYFNAICGNVFWIDIMELWALLSLQMWCLISSEDYVQFVSPFYDPSLWPLQYFDWCWGFMDVGGLGCNGCSVMSKYPISTNKVAKSSRVFQTNTRYYCFWQMPLLSLCRLCCFHMRARRQPQRHENRNELKHIASMQSFLDNWCYFQKKKWRQCYTLLELELFYVDYVVFIM